MFSEQILKRGFFFITRGFTFSKSVLIRDALEKKKKKGERERCFELSKKELGNKKATWIDHWLCIEHFLRHLIYVLFGKHQNHLVIEFK